MTSWKETTLGEIIEVIGGGTPKTSIDEYWNGDIPWLSVVDFNNDQRWVSVTEKHITKKGLENSSTKLLNAGDLIISARGTVGAFAQLKVPMAFNQSCYGLQAKSETTNDFLYYLLKFSIPKLRKNVHGAVFDTITRDTFDKIEISLPPLKEQKEIAGILSSLDDKIDLLRKENETLEKMAQTIFKEWFVNFNFPDAQGKPYKKSGGKMIDSELGEIPEGWRVGKYEDMVDVTTGKGIKKETLKSDGLYQVLGANGEIGKSNEYLFDENLILTGRVGTLGTVYVSKGRVWISDNVLISKPKLEENFYFSYFQMKRLNFESLNRGSTQPLVTQTDLKNVTIVLPELEILRKWHGVILSLFNRIFNNNSQIQTLSQSRDTLLPKLMSGEVKPNL
jgi:type I restriction enzyme S subunit